ncbi:Sec7 and PH-like domain-containing protein [Phanerochaete sordida]|uniref:Sec7 and PH-like domain-containing protein n=1 Tax=Phanerochaete sordida TaxID=48140 RepID=A0A9P3G163_9APHY|nr:Sec7 and PH-like domain-containing protein [Phanerochaete sordida]
MLFASEDQPYILAFSLIMLHTDAFNKSNKRKMTKADYIKNTRLPGVAPEVLDCFYDNIVFAPFIFIEDPLDVTGQRGLLPEGPTVKRLSTLNTSSPGSLNASGSTLLGKNNKVDPYYLITRNLLDDLRVDIRSYIPLTSPYAHQGTGGPWDEDKLLRAFSTANIVEIASENRYMASPWFGLNVGGGPSTVAMMSAPTFPSSHDGITLKVTKVGQLHRKDEVLEGGRKANGRKWREWSVLLTGSQLLFSRDPNWATMVRTQSHVVDGAGGIGHHPLLPRPDETVPLRDVVAVYDRSYTNSANTFRLVIPDGRHCLLQAKDEQDMNEWISYVNYAAAFKTAGVRMRSLGMSGKDIELTGQAAAASHLRDIQHRVRPAPAPRIKTWDGRTSPTAESQDVWAEHTRSPSDTTSEEPITPPMENPSRLFKATFDQVKAELASGSWQGPDTLSILSSRRPRAYSLESSIHSPISPKSVDEGRLSTRTRIIQAKVHDLESKLAVQRSQLEADMRFVKNMAILTPFQRATRDRLQLAVQNAGKRIMQIRLELEKLSCHRDVLTKDLEAEERDWERTKNIAMRAAKLELERKHSLPRMALSMYIDDKASPSGREYAQEDVSPGTRPQSAAESFHSALDFPLYVGPEDKRRLSVVATIDSPASATVSDGSSSPYPESPLPPPLSAQSSLDNSTTTLDAEDPSRASHEKFFTAAETFEEQAEEWNKTRAAKRVSLVRLPSDLRMSVLFGKHARNQTQMPSDDSGSTATTPSRAYHSASSTLSPFTRTNSTVDNVTMLDI